MASGTVPSIGDPLPMLELPDAAGRPVSLRFYRGRLSLVLVLTGEGGDQEWIAAAAAAEREMRDWGAEVLWIAAAPEPGRGPSAAEALLGAGVAGTVLIDAGGEAHRRLGAVDAAGRRRTHARPALIVADRLGEVRYRLDRDGAGPVDLQPAVEWARYLGVIEPECGTCVPAWPAEYLEEE
jgi:AhpC/TSA family